MMLGHVGHQIGASALRIRPRIRSPNGTSLHHHEPQVVNSRIRLQTPGQRRHFSAGDAAGYLLKGSEWLITNAHDVTGAPWFISIPLVALFVSATLRAPLTLSSRRMARSKAKLTPLIQAQQAMVGLGLRKKAVPNLRDRLMAATKKRTKDLYRAFAINERKSIIGGVLTLPIFVSNLEVIRRMCGGPRGMLGNLIFSSSDARAATETTTDSAEALSASTSAAGLPPPTELGDTASSAAQETFNSITLEPSLATGGCLWFPNLLEPDPYHILPFALSALIVLHMMPGTSAARRELFGLKPVAGDKGATLLGQTGARRAFQRTMLIIGLSIGPITMDLPSALHVYWLASSALNLAVLKGTKFFMPIPKNTAKPCRGMEVPLLRPKPPPVVG